MPLICNNMPIRPPKALGLLLGSLFLLLILGGVVYAILQLSSGVISPLLGLWTSIVIVGLPLLLIVVYRLFGLASAKYVLDRDGFHIRWGFAFEQIPLSAIERILEGKAIPSALRPNLGFWWPGCMVGERDVEGLGRVEFFATAGSESQIVLLLKDRSLAISPADVEAFQQAFVDAVRMGSLNEVPIESQRPDFFSARLWADPLARVLILVGLIFILGLLGYLAYRASTLPAEVPFGFDVTGEPDTFAPPTRLLLLPIAGGICWLLDLIAGAWLYRREEDRKMAYVIWGVGALLGGLLWGAVIHLLMAI
jgi:hypothetical protein